GRRAASSVWASGRRMWPCHRPLVLAGRARAPAGPHWSPAPLRPPGIVRTFMVLDVGRRIADNPPGEMVRGAPARAAGGRGEVGRGRQRAGRRGGRSGGPREGAAL